MIALLGLVPPAILIAGYALLLFAGTMPAASFRDQYEDDQ